VFESVGTRGYVLRIIELRVLADAAMAVARGPVSWKTAEDDAFAIQACDVCDAGKRRAVLADRRVGRERKSAATTFFAARVNKQRGCSQYYGNKHAECERWARQARTAFEITSSVDTFPSTGTTAIHAAGRPSPSFF
jgi:hypothetical protein